MSPKLWAVFLFAGVVAGAAIFSGQGDMRAMSPTPTPTVLDRRLARQIQDDLQPFPASLTHDELCKDQKAAQDARVRALANLIGAPDARSLSLEQLATLYKENAGVEVGLLAGGTEYVLASWIPLVCFPPSNALPGTVHYVISRSGEIWDVGWRLKEITWEGDRWVARYDPNELSYGAVWPSHVVHIEQQDGEWVRAGYLGFPPESAISHSVASSFRVENATAGHWQVVLEFSRYNPTAPCDFVDRIDFYSSIENVELTYQWDGTAYTAVGDEVILETIVAIRHRDSDGGETYERLENWQDYCLIEKPEQSRIMGVCQENELQ